MAVAVDEFRMAYAGLKLKRLGEDLAGWKTEHDRVARVWTLEDYIRDAARLGDDLSRLLLKGAMIESLLRLHPGEGTSSDLVIEDHLGTVRSWIALSDELLHMAREFDREGIPVDGVYELHVRGEIARKFVATLDTAKKFFALKKAWKLKTRHFSNPDTILADPSYRAVIAMGLPVVPLILRDLRAGPDHWFAALEEITGDNPVAVEDCGRVRAMADAWLAWGRSRGHI